MEDLAVQVGRHISPKSLGRTSRGHPDMLGTANYVEVTRQQTIITGPGGNPDMVKIRIQELQYLVGHTDYEFNRQRYRSAWPHLSLGWPKFLWAAKQNQKFGAKMRAEDAVHAARAAYEEGSSRAAPPLLNLIPPGAGAGRQSQQERANRRTGCCGSPGRTGAQIFKTPDWTGTPCWPGSWNRRTVSAL